MKTEKQIAEENIKGCSKLNSWWDKDERKHNYYCGQPAWYFVGDDTITEDSSSFCELCGVKTEQHKASCQRFLEFLRGWENGCEDRKCGFCSNCNEKWLKKITDLKQAIKLYEDAEI